MPSLSGVILITGASSGIGRATARAFSGRGQLVVVGRDPQRLQDIASESGATSLAADLTSAQDVKRVAETVAQQWGRLDVLINCAGELQVGPAAELGAEAAERLLRVNFLGAVSLIHACLPLLRKGHKASIINVSSLAGRLAPPYMAAYAASKFALNAYSHSLRQELRSEGIHVGIIQPGPVKTPMTDGKLGGTHYPVPPGVPLLKPERVARAVVAAVERRLTEVVLPRRLALGARLGSAFPMLVDRMYNAMVRFKG